MITAIFLSDSIGIQMIGDSTPKQYLPLAGKPLALYSFETLTYSSLITEIIVVCEKKYQSLFPSISKFSLPGQKRQNSLYNALTLLEKNCGVVLIHEATRPLLTEEDLEKVIRGGLKYGAATLATPVKSNIKRADKNQIVCETFDPSSLYEIQTPQVLKKEILFKGIEKAKKEAITIVDGISLAELVGHPVKLIMGNYENIRITTPEDFAFAENICRERLPTYQV